MWINFLEMRFAVDNSMIFFDRVTKIYGNGQKALDNVSLKVGRGEFVFLEGDSGAGKTTMLELILKETDPTQGNIQVNGIELAGLRERQIYQYRRYIGWYFRISGSFLILRYMRMWHLPSGSWRRITKP